MTKTKSGIETESVSKSEFAPILNFLIISYTPTLIKNYH